MIKGISLVILRIVIVSILAFTPLLLDGQTNRSKTKRAPQKKTAIPVKVEEVKLPPMDSSYSLSYEYTEGGVSHLFTRGRVFKNAQYSAIDSSGNFAFIYREKGKSFVNINGKKYGPYDSVNGRNDSETVPVRLSRGGKFAFVYTIKGKDYININEKIHGPFLFADPRSLSLSSAGDYSFCYLQSKENLYVIINNKKYGPFPGAGNLATGIFDDGKYFFEYTDKAGDFFINIGGKEYRHEDVEFPSGKPEKIFIFKKGDKWFVNNGDSLSGPFKEVTVLDADPSRNMLSYKYRDSSSAGWYLSDRGVKRGPFKNIDLFGNKLYHGNVSVFQFQKDDGIYVSIGDKTEGPYNYTKRLSIIDENNFIFAYEKRNRWYVNLRGETLRGSYGLIDDVAIMANGTFAFSHRDKNNTNRSKLTINSKVTDNEDGYIDELFLANDGKTLTVVNNMGKMYVNAFGTELGPFPNIMSLNATQSGEYYIVASDRQNSRKLVIINGVVFGEFDQIEEPLLGKDGRYLFVGQKNGEYFIYQNGKTSGPYQSLSRFTPTLDWIKGNLVNY